ncbi:L-dopachrome tautomerase yellow-f2-like isoform X2 [Plodia interpunctella]|uniref:L-dopachrome tautomerase yellow-f2-like isoform X2 n=1 Tax=Plodia interpunctella TaxID=58824 RepID=UPI0023689D96|nr:L-dopachrome tautomerase yellow-f2-like isoform X2 [Plodia interpunctella]
MIPRPVNMWPAIFMFMFGVCVCQKVNSRKLIEVASWKQISYNIYGVLYDTDAYTRRANSSTFYPQDLEDSEKFFIQYNNVPIGFEVYNNKAFVTVPRRRHGIPSTLNYILLDGTPSPPLRPYPHHQCDRPVSVYRPRVDCCHRLWMVDTGLLEVPNERKQLRPPAIVIFDLRTNKQILRYELKSTDLVNESTSGGLTSITVDASPQSCNGAYAYINDLATNGLIVFSLKERDSWRIDHTSFVHDPAALNFTVAGHTINWRDGLFSLALSEPRADGSRTAYYHPLVSTQEFSINTENLKKKTKDIEGLVTPLGDRGFLTQSGSHDYHAPTKTLLFGNVAQDAILCWNVETPLKPENVVVVAQNHEKLVYISDRPRWRSGKVLATEPRGPGFDPRSGDDGK